MKIAVYRLLPSKRWARALAKTGIRTRWATDRPGAPAALGETLSPGWYLAGFKNTLGQIRSLPEE